MNIQGEQYDPSLWEGMDDLDPYDYTTKKITTEEVTSRTPKVERVPLEISTVSQLRAKVAAAGPREWAIDGVWIKGTNMVVGAEAKAGKSFAMLDLAVSLASGTDWMNHFKVSAPGPVLCFWAEDDEAEVLRRLDAICADRGVDPDSLAIRMCFRVPNLSDVGSIAEVRKELTDFPASVAILDPLYLAAGENGDGSSIYKMGFVLRQFGDVCRDLGVAPVVIHHWNKTGSGTGRGRFSGSGTVEWARTTVSLSLERGPVRAAEKVDGVERFVTTSFLKWEFAGNSIAPGETVLKRRIWAEADNDLNSALFYEMSSPDVGELSRGVSADVSAREEELVRFFSNNPGASQNAAEKAVGGNATAVRETVKALRVAGRLSHDNRIVRGF